MKANPPGTVLVSEAALREAVGAVQKLENTHNKAAALFHLLSGECAANESEGVCGDRQRERLSCGIMCLCQDMIAEMDERFEVAWRALPSVKGTAPNTQEGGAR